MGCRWRPAAAVHRPGGVGRGDGPARCSNQAAGPVRLWRWRPAAAAGRWSVFFGLFSPLASFLLDRRASRNNWPTSANWIWAPTTAATTTTGGSGAIGAERSYRKKGRVAALTTTALFIALTQNYYISRKIIIYHHRAIVRKIIIYHHRAIVRKIIIYLP
jgi:hypothetical protein